MRCSGMRFYSEDLDAGDAVEKKGKRTNLGVVSDDMTERICFFVRDF